VNLHRTMLRRSLAAVVLTLVAVNAPSVACAKSVDSPYNIHIDNFGKVNDHYFRGAQPDGSDYADLATLGVKTVIDLQRDGRADEQGMVERAGMKFYRIPMTTTDRPAESAIAQFLKIVNDPANQPVFVHCQGGRHRTGTMTAVYRETMDGWTAARAYQEMRQFNFEGFPGHPVLKQFVFDYPAQLARANAANAAHVANAPAAAANVRQ
jgi:tyrosine-protein phosphatase SIW14